MLVDLKYIGRIIWPISKDYQYLIAEIVGIDPSSEFNYNVEITDNGGQSVAYAIGSKCSWWAGACELYPYPHPKVRLRRKAIW